MVDWFDFNKKAIDIALEEYKALRQEIMLLLQQRGQLLTVGLAAIVTVAGIGLTSIANLPKTEVTTKTIEEFPSQSQSKQILTSKPITTELLITEVTDLDPKTNKTIKSSKSQTKTTKTTATNKPLISKDRKEIDSSSFPFDPKIVPAIIFGIIIPVSCIFIIFLWSGYAYRTVLIGRYISENIEIKINKIYFAEFPTIYKPISWETYMQSERWNPEEGVFVGLVFGVIGFLSSILPLYVVAASPGWCLSPLFTFVLVVIFFYRVVAINGIRNEKNSKRIIVDVAEIHRDKKNSKGLKPQKLLAWKEDTAEAWWNQFMALLKVSPQPYVEFASNALESGQLERILRAIGEENIANIAKAVQEDINIPDDDKLNQFIAQVNARPLP